MSYKKGRRTRKVRNNLKLVNKESSCIVSFHIPTALLDAIDQLVEQGVFKNRSDFFRIALHMLVIKYKDFSNPYNKMMTTIR